MSRTNETKRAFILIELLSHGSMGVREIARKAELDKSAVSRTLKTLEEVGIVGRTNDRKYKLTYRILEMGNRSISNLELHPKIDSYLSQLHELSGLYVIVSVLINGNLTIIRSIKPNNTALSPDGKTLYTFPGYKLPIHCTAAGKLFLAYLSPLQRESLIDSLSYDKMASNTIESREKLLEELETVSAGGYAINNDEFRTGTWAAGAPVFNYRQEIYAAVSAVSYEHIKSLKNSDDLINLVVATAKKISFELGYQVS